jgi:hypothetical protein
MTTTVEPQDILHLKSTLGGYVRRGNHAAAEQARRALALAKTEAMIARAIEQAPPLDAATIGRLHSLIPPAPSDEGGAAA